MDDQALDLSIHTYYTDERVWWDRAKSERLKQERGASFEEAIHWTLLTVRAHPERPSQQILFLLHEHYVWLVPCIVGADEVFLKTLYPNRKYTKKWLKGEELI